MLLSRLLTVFWPFPHASDREAQGLRWSGFFKGKGEEQKQNFENGFQVTQGHYKTIYSSHIKIQFVTNENVEIGNPIKMIRAYKGKECVSSGKVDKSE